jgi:predicted DNA-binding transcriptional regulator YafY
MKELIAQAINQKKLIEFTYQGRHRVTEPHVLGITNGIKQVLCYQTGGHSSRGNLPDWRRFDLHEMVGLKVLDTTFPGKRPYPSGRHSSFDHRIAIVQ